MSKNTLFAIVVLFFIANSLFAQVPTSIDLAAIEAAVTDKKSDLYYPSLVKKMRSKEMLHKQEMVHLYYGWAYSGDYKPYFRDPGLRKSVSFLREKEWENAISPAKKVWDDDPVNLQALYYLMIAHHELGDTITAHFYGNLFYRFLDIISESGDGLEIESAFVVNRVSDEYTLLEQYDLEISRQALIGQVDAMTLKEPEITEDNDTILTLYFNVYQPLTHLQNSFSSSKKKKKSKKRRKKDKKARRE
jgi:hypothetical protein